MKVLLEADYHGGCTDLFRAIEEMEWKEAQNIARKSPNQVKTWIRSVGTENTTFDWSKFKRLPIHEACMRQAPAWFISELLSKYPESVSMTTNLEELPLHLAVDKDCGLDVVNMILASNVSAIVAQDQTGRTPIDIMDSPEMMKLDEYRAIYDSLERCLKMYIAIQKKSQDEQTLIKHKHKAVLSAVSKRHQEELRTGQDKQAKQQVEMDELKNRMEEMIETDKAKDRLVKQALEEKDRSSEQIRDLEAQLLDLKQSLESEQDQVRVLQSKLERKERDIAEKNYQVNLLSNDLKNIVVSNETDVMEALIETESSMRKMVSNQIALQKLLVIKAKGLNEILIDRNIQMPEEEIQARTLVMDESRQGTLSDDENSHADKLDTDEAEAASAAMMEAAMAALQPVPSY
mmetsp:Transcript_14209/g.34261  ORF Transcript_14209/g.34261 Transcript_14209/m.34261 type:complete len:404 (+) Transcript_14209:294-1505(+)